METALIFLLLAVPLAIFYFSLKHSKKSKKTSPPGPPGLPFIGNLLQEFNHEYMYKLSKQYGELMSLRLGTVPTLIVSSAKLAKEVYKTQDLNFSNRPNHLGQQTLSYNGLDIAFAPYGEYWREMRKFGTLHLFTNKRALSFRPVREEEVSRLLNAISNIAASPSGLVDVSEVTLNLTSSVISRVSFGRRYDEDGIGKEKFKRVFTESQYVISKFYFSDYFPMLGWIDKISGMKARLSKSFRDLDLFYQQLIDEHLKPDRRDSAVEDVIDILLNQMGNTEPSAFSINMENIKAVLMNIFIGGTDSSSSTMIGSMTALMRNPKAMKKAQEEVRSVVGNKGRVDEVDIPHLPYVRAVVKESMRLYPPFMMLVPRETMEDCVLGTYEVKAKTLVYVNAWAVGRDPEAWEKPLEFKPERFMERPDLDFKGQHFELLPFGGGRRGCPGITLGAAIVELTVANLLYAFDWELPPGVKIEEIDDEMLPGLTMQRKNKLYLRPTPYAAYAAAAWAK